MAYMKIYTINTYKSGLYRLGDDGVADIEERVAKLEVRCDGQDRRLNNMDNLVQSVTTIAVNVENVQNVVNRVEDKVDTMDGRILEVEKKPGTVGLKAWTYVIVAFGGGFLAWLISQIGTYIGG